MKAASAYAALMTMLLSASCVWAEDKTQPDPERWNKTIQAFTEWDSKNSWPSQAVLFVGSSSIRMWPTREAFPNLPVMNRGFGGSHISDVLHYADEIVLRYEPRVIVFYAGDNDVAAGKTAERVFCDYQKFVAKVHAARPQTQIIFLTIKPSASRWQHWPTMNRANQLIRRLCDGDDHLIFADVGKLLLDETGKPDTSLFLGDRLHLNAQGYAAWRKVLAPLLELALGRNQRARRE